MSTILSTRELEGKSNRSSTACLAISGPCSLTDTGGSVAYIIMAWVGPDGEKAKNSNVGLAMTMADLNRRNQDTGRRGCYSWSTLSAFLYYLYFFLLARQIEKQTGN